MLNYISCAKLWTYSRRDFHCVILVKSSSIAKLVYLPGLTPSWQSRISQGQHYSNEKISFLSLRLPDSQTFLYNVAPLLSCHIYLDPIKKRIATSQVHFCITRAKAHVKIQLKPYFFYSSETRAKFYHTGRMDPRKTQNKRTVRDPNSRGPKASLLAKRNTEDIDDFLN